MGAQTPNSSNSSSNRNLNRGSGGGSNPADVVSPSSFSQPVDDEGMNEFDDSDLQEYHMARFGGPAHRNNSNMNFNHQWSPTGLEELLPTNILIVSLIEHLCSTIELNPTRMMLLFEGVIHELVKLKILSPIPALKEFSSVRRKYMSVFLSLVKSLRQSLHPMIEAAPRPLSSIDINSVLANVNVAVIFPHPNLERIMTFGREQTFGFSSSRYAADFDEIERLGKGGFGSVYRVKSKLDGCMYAVKKIKMKSEEQCYKMIKEVKVLAALQHPNIVKYNTAWMDTVLTRGQGPRSGVCGLLTEWVGGPLTESARIRHLSSVRLEYSAEHPATSEPSTSDDDIQFKSDSSEGSRLGADFSLEDTDREESKIESKKSRIDSVSSVAKSYSDPSPIERRNLYDSPDLSRLVPRGYFGVTPKPRAPPEAKSSLSTNRRKLSRLQLLSQERCSAVVTANYFAQPLFRRSFSAPSEHEEAPDADRGGPIDDDPCQKVLNGF